MTNASQTVSESPLVAAVRAAASGVIDPELRVPIGELGMVESVTVENAMAHVGVQLTIVGCPASDRIERDVRAAALSVAGIEAVEVALGVMSPAQRTALTEKLRGGKRAMPFDKDSLTRVVLVSSGKGGVGKSTISANLAVALAERGRRVGLIDADVHGFSIPQLMGLTDASGRAPQPTRIDRLMLPPVAHGVKVISIGMFLPDPDAVVAWRGPMLHRTVQQFLTDVHFGDLDYLLIDMPPGTGDIAISIGQLLPHAGVIVVTTPQPTASDVAIRSGRVARQTGQHVIGVIENMAAMTLPDGTVLDLFGAGGGHAVADALRTETENVTLLGSVPLDTALRASADRGEPIVVSDPADPAAVVIARVAAELDRSGPSLAGKPLSLRPTSDKAAGA